MTLVRLSQLSWPEARDLGADADVIALVPTGSLEQHGPHLPLEMDAVLAQALACAAAEQVTGPVIVAPVVGVGISPHHAGFPGTVTLSDDGFRSIVTAYVEGFERMGVRRIALLSGHGGNFLPIGRFARDLDESPTRRVVAFDDLDRFVEVMFKAGRAAGLDPPATDWHAGCLETSVALHLFEPARIGDFQNLTGYVEDADGWQAVMADQGVLALSDTGILGDPRSANALAGRMIFTALVDEITAWLQSELPRGSE